MWQLLSSIVNGFLLLRDFFGYLLPGIALGIIVLGVPADLSTIFVINPEWLSIILQITVCYLAGQILVALGYFTLDLIESLATKKPLSFHAPKPDPDLFLYHYLYPGLFVEKDRQETIHILRIGLAVALVLGCGFRLVTGPHNSSMIIAEWAAGLAAGLFMVRNTYIGQDHQKKLAQASIEAAKEAAKLHVPYFQWNEHGSEGSGQK
jgi:hypothetical protein